MLCLTSKSYQLCQPRQADIREQLHCLGSKTDVDIVTLIECRSGFLFRAKNCSAFRDRRIENRSNRETYLRSKKRIDEHDVRVRQTKRGFDRIRP